MFVVPGENSSIESPYKFPLQTLFSFIYIAKYFFVIRREGFGDKDVSVRLEVKVRKISRFLVNQRRRYFSHSHQVNWGSSSIVRRYRVRNRNIFVN